MKVQLSPKLDSRCIPEYTAMMVSATSVYKACAARSPKDMVTKTKDAVRQLAGSLGLQSVRSQHELLGSNVHGGGVMGMQVIGGGAFASPVVETR